MEYLFVYNANSDLVSSMVDYAHKVIRPSTYRCKLCVLTHHNVGERKAWRAFQESVTIPFTFMYIKGFETAFDERFNYPVVLEKSGSVLKPLLSREELEKLKNVHELIRTLDALITTT